VYDRRFKTFSYPAPEICTIGIRVVSFCSMFLALVISANRASRATEPQRILRAGAHAIDITPTTIPVDSAGNMSPFKAIRAYDPLHARCLLADRCRAKDPQQAA